MESRTTTFSPVLFFKTTTKYNCFVIKLNYVQADQCQENICTNSGQEIGVSPQAVNSSVVVTTVTAKETPRSSEPSFPAEQKKLVVDSWHYVKNHFGEVIPNT